MQETQVQFLGGKDPVEKEMSTHSMENPMDRGAWQATVHGVTRVGYGLATISSSSSSRTYHSMEAE